MFIHEEFKNEKPIIVTESLLKKYDEMKKESNRIKSQKSLNSNINNTQPEKSETEEEKIEEEFPQIQASKNDNEDFDNINNISDLLEKSCIMTEDEENKERKNKGEKLSKKTLYSVMDKNSDLEGHDPSKLGQTKKLKFNPP